ncbi:unnamed protein product [Polarella glacialis]|uniref:Uncharacterized protein n=1 Tax=Polarella glacialis TaxID=89957 RepID=A0A813KCC8_POLGL|nr:unnamed protein product [Polarella glacialis]
MGPGRTLVPSGQPSLRLALQRGLCRAPPPLARLPNIVHAAPGSSGRSVATLAALANRTRPNRAKGAPEFTAEGAAVGCRLGSCGAVRHPLFLGRPRRSCGWVSHGLPAAGCRDRRWPPCIGRGHLLLWVLLPPLPEVCQLLECVSPQELVHRHPCDCRPPIFNPVVMAGILIGPEKRACKFQTRSNESCSSDPSYYCAHEADSRLQDKGSSCRQQCDCMGGYRPVEECSGAEPIHVIFAVLGAVGILGITVTSCGAMKSLNSLIQAEGGAQGRASATHPSHPVAAAEYGYGSDAVKGQPVVPAGQAVIVRAEAAKAEE